MFSQLLKPVLTEEVKHPCTIEEVRHSIQKERRIIDTLEPVMNSHKLVVCKSVVEQDISLFKGLYSGQSRARVEPEYSQSSWTQGKEF